MVKKIIFNDDYLLSILHSFLTSQYCNIPGTVFFFFFEKFWDKILPQNSFCYFTRMIAVKGSRQKKAPQSDILEVSSN